MSYDPDNDFARILRGELPCEKVYEDEQTFAFMDIMPQVDGHCLVIPKEPAVTLLELSPASAAALIQTVQKIARAAKQALNASGVALMQFNGEGAGQTVPHVHFHVLPGSGLRNMRLHATHRGDPEAIAAFARKIIAALQSA